MMQKSDSNFVKKIQKKLECRERDCGTHFELSINENVLKFSAEAKKVYKGKCGKCLKGLTLLDKDLHTFARLFGQPKVIVNKSEFDNFFEIEK